MIITQVIFTREYVTANAIVATLLAIAFYVLLNRIEDRRKNGKSTGKQFAEGESIGFYLGVANMIALVMILFFTNYVF